MTEVNQNSQNGRPCRQLFRLVKAYCHYNSPKNVIKKITELNYFNRQYGFNFVNLATQSQRNLENVQLSKLY